MLGHDGSYFKQLPRMLQVKRDEVYKALKEVGMNPIILEGAEVTSCWPTHQI